MRAYVPGFALLALAACGGDSGNNQFAGRSPEEIEAMMGQGSGGPIAESGTAGQGTADAESINCSGLAAPNGPDVVGVSIGMSAEDAYRAIACSNRSLRVTYSDQGGFQLPPLPDGRRPRKSIHGENNQERIDVALVGMPGAERVVTIRRTVAFAQGQEPALNTLIAQLQQKYGALTHNPNQYGAWSGHALRGPDNQPIPTGSLLESRCAVSVGMNAGQPDLLGDCGLSVAVHIEFGANEQIARQLMVSMSNGAFGVQQIEAIVAIARGAAQQQQAREVQEAAGRRPTL